MAVATGTAALIGAGIQAAGGLGGAALANRGAGRAADRQAQANREALEFQREMFEEEMRREDERIAREQAQWDAYQQQRAPYRAAAASILGRYGINVPADSMGGAPPTAAPAGGSLRTFMDGPMMNDTATADVAPPLMASAPVFPRSRSLADFMRR